MDVNSTLRSMVFLILGVVFGMTAGMIHLVQFARRISEKDRQAEKDTNE